MDWAPFLNGGSAGATVAICIAVYRLVEYAMARLKVSSLNGEHDTNPQQKFGTGTSERIVKYLRDISETQRDSLKIMQAMQDDMNRLHVRFDSLADRQ